MPRRARRAGDPAGAQGSPEAGRSNRAGHADRFWAVVLACQKERAPAGAARGDRRSRDRVGAGVLVDSGGISVNDTFRRALWLFPCATTLHNIEEALWLPAWSQRGTHLHAPVGAPEFRFAVLVLTAAAWAVTLLAARRGGKWLAVAAGYWVAMLGNVVLPHLVASILERGYTPGIVTALALNLPVNAYLLRRVVREGHLTKAAVARAAILVVPAVIGAIPALFILGRALWGMR
jgi:hypothetical protein